MVCNKTAPQLMPILPYKIDITKDLFNSRSRKAKNVLTWAFGERLSYSKNLNLMTKFANICHTLK